MGLPWKRRGRKLAAKMRADLHRARTPEWLRCPCGTVYDNHDPQHVRIHAEHIHRSWR